MIKRMTEGTTETIMDGYEHQVLPQGSGISDAAGAPAVVDRAVFQAELDALRVREKAHTREGDAIAAARRRLPMSRLTPLSS
jgi:hypothetical protein